MSAWVLIPCLIGLRTEFNMINPTRDKGADGSIGDSSHTSSSDHTPDEDSDVLRDHDADSKNEVHALDIDSSGPWPSAGWFDRKINEIRLEERRRWLDPNDKCRLKYVIWGKQIANQDTDFLWRSYGGSDPHTNHAHFSGRYETVCENDTRPWGVATALQGEEDMPLNDADKTWITNAISSAVRSGLIGQVGDVVPRWSDAGGALPAGDANPEMTPASALYYIGATARRAENQVADARARLAELQSNVITLSQAVAELSARQGQIISQGALVEAIRSVLREGTGE